MPNLLRIILYNAPGARPGVYRAGESISGDKCWKHISYKKTNDFCLIAFIAGTIEFDVRDNNTKARGKVCLTNLSLWIQIPTMQSNSNQIKISQFPRSRSNLFLDNLEDFG